MAEPTEDIPYEISDHAVADDNTTDEDNQSLVNDEIIKEIREYCEKEIANGNSFDILNLPSNATPEQKQAVFDEIAIHKGVTMHLRNILDTITNKVKEQ